MIPKIIIVAVFVVLIALLRKQFVRVFREGSDHYVQNLFRLIMPFLFGVAGYFLALLALLLDRIERFGDVAYAFTHSPFHFGWSGMIALLVGLGLSWLGWHHFRLPVQKPDQFVQGRPMKKSPPADKPNSLISAEETANRNKDSK